MTAKAAPPYPEGSQRARDWRREGRPPVRTWRVYDPDRGDHGEVIEVRAASLGEAFAQVFGEEK